MKKVTNGAETKATKTVDWEAKDRELSSRIQDHKVRGNRETMQRLYEERAKCREQLACFGSVQWSAAAAKDWEECAKYQTHSPYAMGFSITHATRLYEELNQFESSTRLWTVRRVLDGFDAPCR